MKYTATLLALAVGAMASLPGGSYGGKGDNHGDNVNNYGDNHGDNGNNYGDNHGGNGGYGGPKNVTHYTTEVVTSLVTYCPEPTTIVQCDKTYVVTTPTTLTITDCPCTVTKPIYTTSTVICHNCNATKPTGGDYTPPKATPTKVTAGAGKLVAVTGAGLAGLMGLAAFAL